MDQRGLKLFNFYLKRFLVYILISITGSGRIRHTLKIIHQYFSKDDYLDKKNELIAECKYHIYFAAKEFDYSKNTKFSFEPFHF